jgi:hypothetical protein
MPALVARRHVEPLLEAADEMRRRAAGKGEMDAT